MEKDSKIVFGEGASTTLEENADNKRPLKKILVYLSILIASVYLIFFAFGAGFGSHPDSATITSIEGLAMIQREGSSLAIPADKGMKIFSGDVVTSLKNSTLEMQFEDLSISRMGPDSRLRLQDIYSNPDGSSVISIKLSSGRLWNTIKEFTERNSRFEVYTPNTVAGVRGTGFSVEIYDGNDYESGEKSPITTYRVYEGSVGVGGAETYTEENGDTKAVNSGEQGSVVANEIFEKPEPLRVMEVDVWDKDNLVEYLPVSFVEIETEVKTIKADEAVDLIEKNTAEREELVSEMLGYQEEIKDAAEEERGFFYSVIKTIEEEIELVNELIDILEEESEELDESKRTLEGILNLIIDKKSEITDKNELNYIVKEVVGYFWQDEKDLAENNIERNKRKEEVKEGIESARNERDRIINGNGEGEQATLSGENDQTALSDENDQRVFNYKARRSINPFVYNVTTPVYPDRTSSEGSSGSGDDRGSAGYIRITVQPENITAGYSFQKNPTVRVFDRYGNPVSNARVTVSKSSGSFAMGTLTVRTDNSGTAVFGDLLATKAGKTTLSFNTGGIQSAKSAEFTVYPAKANKIEIIDMPLISIAGKSLSSAPKIKTTDRYGNPVGGQRVTASLNKGSFASGITTHTTGESGILTYDNLSINKADSNYRIIFSASGLEDSTSAAFNVVASDPDPLKSGATCNSPINVNAKDFSLGIIAKDQFRNSLTGRQNVTVRYGNEIWFTGTAAFNINGEATVSLSVPGAGYYTGVKVSVNDVIVHSLDFITE